jgi:uncharacterized RDD family membrane protein YckC
MIDESNKYAGFWIRFVAYLIDGLFLLLAETILILPLLGLFGYNLALLDSLAELDHVEPDILIMAIISAGTAIYISCFLVTWLYFAILQSGPRQATIGKMALNLKVVDANGNRLTFARASLRYFSKIISTAIFMIGFIMAGFTAKKQALHDIIVDTYVIRKQAA